MGEDLRRFILSEEPESVRLEAFGGVGGVERAFFEGAAITTELEPDFPELDSSEKLHRLLPHLRA